MPFEFSSPRNASINNHVLDFGVPGAVDRVQGAHRGGGTMKTFALIFALSGFAFVVIGYQLELFELPDGDEEGQAVAAADADKSPEPSGLQFPEDLLPACRGLGVPQAAAYDPRSGKPHPLTFLYEDGKLRQEWQEQLDDDWIAEKVERTELVVVVSKDTKLLLSVQNYANGAPPIYRYQYDMSIRVVAAKTGLVMARNHFVSTPRQIRQVESWELTALGQPVSFTTVFNWVKSHALAGFPMSRATAMRAR
jgi:hypothetical protein